jgi:hypothetical protein
MKMKIIQGVSKRTWRCESWLEHWQEGGGGTLPLYCAEVNCTQAPEMGGIAMKAEAADAIWYVIPLCKEHGTATGHIIDIFSGTKLVRVDSKPAYAK